MTRHAHSHAHGHGHSHSHARRRATAPVERTRALILVGILVVVGLATIVGAIRWWPDHAKAESLRGTLTFAVEGSTYVQATVTDVQPRCAEALATTPTCGNLVVTLDDGPEAGSSQTVGVPPEVLNAGLEPGDSVELLRLPAREGSDVSYSWYDVQRETPLWALGLVFVAATIAVARMRGLLALVSLAIAGGVIWWFLLPGMITGGPPLALAVVASSLIMYLVLYLTHGVSIRTSTALAGTLIGIAISAIAANWAIDSSHLNGVIDDGGSTLSTLLPALNLHNVLKAAAVIASLGALNDVTITQASGVWELREASPQMSRWELYRSAMRIGRDHVASAIYTLAFAYVGTALTLLLAIGLYDRSIFSLLGAEEIAEEIVRSLAGGLGLLAAMPATTLIGVLVVAAVTSKVDAHGAQETGSGSAAEADPSADTAPVGRHAAPDPG